MMSVSKKSRTALAATALLVLVTGVGIVSYLSRRPVENTEAAANQAQVEGDTDILSGTTVQPLPVVVTVQHLTKEIQDELDRVDPSHDGWDSEAVNDAAMECLHKIGDAIEGLHKTGEIQIDQVASGFQSTRLRPISTQTVFDDGSTRITRSTDDHAQSPAHQDLNKALTELFGENISRVKDVHIAFKIIRVELNDGGASTKTKVLLSYKSDSSHLQYNSYWHCGWRRSGDTRLMLESIALESFEEIVSKDAGPFLTDCTESVLGKNDAWLRQFGRGIDHWRDNLDWRLGLDVAGPHGLAVADVNGDGLDDLFVCEPGGLPNRLFLQQPDGTARDASAEFGVDWLEPATSALLVDLDNDGDQDLVFTSGRYLIVCDNQNQASFQMQHVESMSGVARSISAADFDNDGLLDIYVCCYINRDVALDDVGLGMPMPYHDANNGPGNVLFKNAGGLKLQDVTADVGLDQNNRRFSYAAAWEDYDRDGDVDLYVANDFGRNNLYQNAAGRFQDVAAQAGVEDIATGMSVSWGDYNRDGHQDLYVGNMFSTAGNRVMYQRRFQSGADEATRNVFRRLARGNSLFLNNGDGTFRDVSLEERATFGRWAWASIFFDLNNDGWEDLLVANGMITSQEDTGDL